MLKVVGCDKRTVGSVYYEVDSLALDFRPHSSHASGCSVMINCVELALDVHGFVVGLDGYCPHNGWCQKNLTMPTSTIAMLQYSLAGELIPGSVPRLNETDTWPGWPVFYDPKSGTVCLDGGVSSTASIEALPGVVIEIGDDGNPVRLWCMLANKQEVNDLFEFSSLI